MALLTAAHGELLSPIERKRCMGFRQHEDRTRFILATALLRLVAGAWLDTPPEKVLVDRTCEHCLKPHGRPRLPGTDLHASISHAGKYVAVALSSFAPVGVDIEQIRRIDYAPLLAVVCTASERRYVTSDADFYAYWTRKESILKATGVGLSLPMTEVEVTAPGEAPRILAYDRQAEFPAQMTAPFIDARYSCAVTVLTVDPICFRVRTAEDLLASQTANAKTPLPRWLQGRYRDAQAMRRPS